jgi:aldose 1-epimerase
MHVPETDLVLRNERVELGIARTGGAVTFCTVAGQPLFHPASEATEPFPFANFMLAPFSNRIAGCGFIFGGTHHEVRPNLADPRFLLPIHGFGWQATWSIVPLADDHALLTLALPEASWPSPLSLKQDIRLTHDGYKHSVFVSNEGDQPMPAGIGLHPYFPSGATAMRTGCNAIWLTGEDGIPHAHELLAAEPDWFQQDAVDCGFDWPSGAARIDWPDRSVAILADPVFSQAVVYIPRGRPFFCFEPVSHSTNAINRSTGMQILAPGETLSGTVGFSLTSTGGRANHI